VFDEVVVWREEQDDDWAGGFAHDLVDQIKCVLGAFRESDERDVGTLGRGHRSYVFDVDLSCDRFVAERDDDCCDKGEAVRRSFAIRARRWSVSR
jgi:hypothetical protein